VAAAPPQPLVGSHVTVGRRRQTAPLDANGVPSPNLVSKKRHDCYDTRAARGTAADDPCFGVSPSIWDMLARHLAMPGLQLLQSTAARICCDQGESCPRPGRDRRRLRQLQLGDLEVRAPDHPAGPGKAPASSVGAPACVRDELEAHAHDRRVRLLTRRSRRSISRYRAPMQAVTIHTRSVPRMAAAVGQMQRRRSSVGTMGLPAIAFVSWTTASGAIATATKRNVATSWC
jgi:hypothetical protein